MTTEEFFTHGQQKKNRNNKHTTKKPITDEIVIQHGSESVTPKRNGNFIRLTDKTIISIKDILLVNVEGTPSGNEKYSLYLTGKHMTLRLSEEDYNFINHSLFDDNCAEDC